MADANKEIFLWILAFITNNTYVQEQCRNEIIKVLYNGSKLFVFISIYFVFIMHAGV